jgi:hypothetical protein
MYLGNRSMYIGGSFYSPKGPKSHWSSIWKGPDAFCPRSGAHQTQHSGTVTRSWLVTFRVSVSGGHRTVQWGHRTVRWATWPLAAADVLDSRWLSAHRTVWRSTRTVWRSARTVRWIKGKVSSLSRERPVRPDGHRIVRSVVSNHPMTNQCSFFVCQLSFAPFGSTLYGPYHLDKHD